MNRKANEFCTHFWSTEQKKLDNSAVSSRNSFTSSPSSARSDSPRLLYVQSSNDFIWNQICSLAPFVKMPNGPKTERTVRIGSKNETEERLARQLHSWIREKAVILSHTPNPNQQHCRGIVDAVEYRKKRVEVTVTSDSVLPIWEDTDIWLFPDAPLYESPYSLEPSTSSTDPSPLPEEPTEKDHRQKVEQPPDIPLKSSEEQEFQQTGASDEESLQKTQQKQEQVDQKEVFEGIHGWKYVDGQFRRMRRKCGDKWKNVYLSELRMSPVDPAKRALLEQVKEHTVLRLSDDIDEIGEVFVEVCKKNANENTICLGVTGFSRNDIDMPLSTSTTYYLSIDDGDDDELASLASEEEVLPGYRLEQNVDELCERLGTLTVTDVCVKTWFAKPHNIVFLRLAVSSTRSSLKHFKNLLGLHVIINQPFRDRDRVMAVVSKVMKSDMILTVKGFPKDGGRFVEITKQHKFTIQIDHDYETRIQRMGGRLGEHERLRRSINSDYDLKLVTSRQDSSRKTFASFHSKNEALYLIPFGTKILLGKCWEIEGPIEKKAEFIFAIRVEDRDPKTLTFEIKFTKTLVNNAPQFKLTNAFYFMELDSSSSIAIDPNYSLYDVRDKRCRTAGILDTASKSVSIQEYLKFDVIEYHPKMARSEVPQESRNSHCLDRTKLPEIQPQKHRYVCFVFLQRNLAIENGSPMVQVRTGYDKNSRKIQMQPWSIGKRLVFTESSTHPAIRFIGEVQDTLGDTATLRFDKNLSDLEFFQRCSFKTVFQCFEEI
ncbi:unnamed protein product [Caenorhabditis sp. 36 PRJEB53466]|nr:unnamed protein product [Caenorhabditis sp. 36 PRJEB53466]